MEELCDFSWLTPYGCAHCLGIKVADWETVKPVTIYE